VTREPLRLADDGDLERNRHFAVQTNRNIVFADGLDGVQQVDLALVELELKLLLHGIGDIAGGDTAVEAVVLSGADAEGDGAVLKLSGGLLGAVEQLLGAAVLRA
jgi:hypothetical protein